MPDGQQPNELIEALKTRGVTAKTAQELVEAHPPGRIRTKLEVFDWLLRNEDRRVGKNPAGYLVASIRSDYQAPGDYQARGDRGQAGRGRRPSGSRPLAQAQRRASEEVQDQRDKAREAKLRAAWERLTEAEREAIRAAVKAENPGLGRWKNMIEPLCLTALEARMKRIERRRRQRPATALSRCRAREADAVGGRVARCGLPALPHQAASPSESPRSRDGSALRPPRRSRES